MCIRDRRSSVSSSAEELTDERRARLRERHKQVMLARKRNGSHIGEQPKRKPKKLTQQND